MRASYGLGIAVAASIALGCTAGPAPSAATAPAAETRRDKPYDLGDDRDLQHVRGEYRALPVGSAERTALRAELAAEHARRIGAHLDRRERQRAYAAFTSLLTLWDPRELEEPEALAQLAEHRGVLDRVRAHFARSGDDREAATALFALAVAEPDRRRDHLDEIDEIFAFADELAVARYGEGAQRARPIEILEHAVSVVPTQEVLDRLIDLYAERQDALSSTFQRSGAELRLIRAHGNGVLRATWNVIRAHALASRLEDAPSAARRITDFGDDAALRRALERAVSAPADEAAWLALAEAFVEDEGDDPEAALRVCEHALEAMPGSAKLHRVAAERAIAADELALARRFLERAVTLDPEARDAADRLAAIYEHRVAQLSFDERPGAAGEALAHLAELDERARATWPDEPLETTLVDGYAAMGRGLVAIGELEEARDYLARATAGGPHLRALEYLGLLELKLERFDHALTHLGRALDVPPGEPIDRFDRARILRLFAEAARGAGDEALASAHADEALAAWTELDREIGPMRAAYQGQMLVEVGKLRWLLGDRDGAIDAFERAVDADPDGATTHTSIVAHLIVRDERGAALDAYHRALGSREIDDYFKVYMSLWVLIDAHLEGRQPDPLARRYLERQAGRLWHHDLARWATGRAELSELSATAETRARRAELLYYRAMLDAMPAAPRKAEALLRRVLTTDMVMFFEYDMARRWLERGLDAAD